MDRDYRDETKTETGGDKRQASTKIDRHRQRQIEPDRWRQTKAER